MASVMHIHGPMQQVSGAVPQPQPQGSQQPPQAAQQGDLDPISKCKLLLPRLKDSLIALFRVAGHVFRVNAVQDSGGQAEGLARTERFEKSLEDFCGICDQIEVCLRLALELHHQIVDSVRNTPLSVMIPKSEPPGGQQEGQSYAQYLTTVRTQINFAKEIHDLLHETVSKLMEKSNHLPPQQQQQPPPPPAPSQPQE